MHQRSITPPALASSKESGGPLDQPIGCNRANRVLKRGDVTIPILSGRTLQLSSLDAPPAQRVRSIRIDDLHQPDQGRADAPHRGRTRQDVAGQIRVPRGPGTWLSHFGPCPPALVMMQKRSTCSHAITLKHICGKRRATSLATGASPMMGLPTCRQASDVTYFVLPPLA
jgi:hypothetical protein